MEVAAVDRSARPAVQRAAAEIDKHLATHWQEHGVSPSPPLDDAQFLRRMYLELGGRIPSYDEARRFLASKSKTKRADLIDDLLESPDYVSHFYNFWADILRLLERPQRTLVFEPYLWYVKDSIAANKPYDRWVHEMLTADGRLWENPAVGFQLRDAGMELPYVDNTVRVFLGTQIGCASATIIPSTIGRSISFMNWRHSSQERSCRPIRRAGSTRMAGRFPARCESCSGRPSSNSNVRSRLCSS